MTSGNKRRDMRERERDPLRTGHCHAAHWLDRHAGLCSLPTVQGRAVADASLVWRRWRRSGQAQAQGGGRLGGSRVDPCVRDEAEDLG